jgi:exopolysaccharide biosynthesis polyprenyl glycosylphosphotransferase
MSSFSSDKVLVTASSEHSSARTTSARWLETVLFQLSLLVSDILMLGLAMRLAYWIRFELGLPIFEQEALSSVLYYRSLVLLIIPIWVLVFFLRGLYFRPNLMGGTREYDLIFQANNFAIFIIIAIGFFQESVIFARGWLVITWASAFLLTTLGRFLVRRMIYRLREKGFFLSRTMIIGFNEEAALMAEQLKFSRNSGLNLLGVVDDHYPADPTPLPGLPALGPLDCLDEIIQKHQVEEIILTTSALSQPQILEIFQKYGVANGIRVRMSSGLYEIITTGLQVKEVAWVPLVEVNKARMTGADLVLKNALDYLITIPGLIVISPLLLLIALAIKLDSPGPVIHRRRVMGVNGKQFDAFKFRTMHLNGDLILAAHPELKEELARNHKLKNDPRITRVGRILRKTSLDELTQLFNVLRGEMSLVGPRMITQEEVAEYKKWGMNLLTVKPGITGKWQVSGRSEISYQERVRLDMYYIRNWTIWLDIQLLVQTIPAVLTRRGAY